MVKARTRVMVVEDSTTVRNVLCETLASDPAMEVVAVAGDGNEAIAMCEAFRPDVITMDMMMPVMNGLEATAHIMAYCPTPILVVSSSTNRGELFKTYEALAAGAVDVLEKPTGGEPPGDWERRFLSSLKLVSRIKVITHLRGRSQRVSPDRPPTPRVAAKSGAERGARVVAIGASTGGPGAVVDVLRALPVHPRLPVLFVLHINPQFGHAFADWLSTQTQWPARFARSGESIAEAGGQVLLAPADYHMIVRDRRIRLDRGPERHSCRPSVDVLFESVASEYGKSATAALLTGMGRDGAAGLLAIRAAGGVTIAQDEATSVVFGMPREAMLLGAVDRVLPLGEIGPALARSVDAGEKVTP